MTAKRFAYQVFPIIYQANVIKVEIVCLIDHHKGLIIYHKVIIKVHGAEGTKPVSTKYKSNKERLR